MKIQNKGRMISVFAIVFALAILSGIMIGTDTQIVAHASGSVATVTLDLNSDGDTVDDGEVLNYDTFEEAWNAAVGYNHSKQPRSGQAVE